MKPLSVIKLGGAAITDPHGPDGLNIETARRLTQEIASLPTDVLLVHGTGAVGKPAAHQHGFVDTGLLPKEKSLVSCGIHRQLRSLNQRLIELQLDLGLPSLGVDPAMIFNREFSGLSGTTARDHLSSLLLNGVMPVLYGDMVTTEDGSFKVLSSDVIAAVLARELGAQHLIFLSDVPGVYSTRHDPLAKPLILDKIGINDLENPALFGPSDREDVSGGMRAKIRFALEASQSCESCWIGSAHTEGILTRFFADGVVTGTRIISS